MDDKQSGRLYLESLLNKTLQVSITDGRMFAGQLKCTDRERNIILSMTQEHRQVRKRKELSGDKTSQDEMETQKRFVGLIVVPGQYITKIEVEE